MADFLLEIGVEEIPDWMIDGALASLRGNYSDSAGALNGSIEMLDATPRRLVLLATKLDETLPEVNQVIAGPYVSAGSKAAEGFAKKNQTTLEALHRDIDAKGERYFFVSTKKGESAFELLTGVVPALITGIPWPKAMYWGGRDTLRFIRPIRWLVALLDKQILPVSIGGVQAGNTTRGHRVLSSGQPIPVTVSNYEQVLRENSVIVRATERKTRIQRGLGSDVEPDTDLLSTLVYLTEFPAALRGAFDPEYLELPKEILSTVMRHHQRYFSVLNADGSLAPQFIAVTNSGGDPDGLIRQGNERVLRARFNDARFFWQVDQKRKLADRYPDLKSVTFFAKLGNYLEKTDRIRALIERIAEGLTDKSVCLRAALLSKCDLTTDMVKEFTDLQGIVGGLYAKAQGESEAVAIAIYDHYKPVSMEDSIPRTAEGQLLSIADKLDTLRECFRIGLAPTGSKDPFALRRAAQGLVKILFDARLPLELMPLVKDVPDLANFLKERVQFYLRDSCDFAYDEVNSVLATPFTTLPDMADRVSALHDIRSTEDFEPLAASFKRIKNILRQAQVEGPGELNTEQLVPGPERDLYDAFVQVRNSTRNIKLYGDKLAAIASLRPRVDLFFDKILVNDPDEAIRQNRLALLHSLLSEFSNIADFSEIVTVGGVNA